jgi:hypothetical protein
MRSDVRHVLRRLLRSVLVDAVRVDVRSGFVPERLLEREGKLRSSDRQPVQERLPEHAEQLLRRLQQRAERLQRHLQVHGRQLPRTVQLGSVELLQRLHVDWQRLP